MQYFLNQYLVGMMAISLFLLSLSCLSKNQAYSKREQGIPPTSEAPPVPGETPTDEVTNTPPSIPSPEEHIIPEGPGNPIIADAEQITEEKNDPPGNNDYIVNGIIQGNNAEDIRFQNNPWFIQEMAEDKTIQYCIEEVPNSSERGFSLEVTKVPDKSGLVNRKIQSTLMEWSSAIEKFRQREYLINNKYKHITQFVEVPCTEGVPLRFLLGAESPETRSFYEESGIELIASAITSSTIRSVETITKGYIWFTPDLGTKRFRSQNPEYEGFWQKSDNFSYVLSHELGHIFGVPHDSTRIMDKTFPSEVIENSVLKKNYPTLTLTQSLYSSFEYQIPTFCGKFEQGNPFLPLPQKIVRPNVNPNLSQFLGLLYHINSYCLSLYLGTFQLSGYDATGKLAFSAPIEGKVLNSEAVPITYNSAEFVSNPLFYIFHNSTLIGTLTYDSRILPVIISKNNKSINIDIELFVNNQWQYFRLYVKN